jgi:hypothetical protein
MQEKEPRMKLPTSRSANRFEVQIAGIFRVTHYILHSAFFLTRAALQRKSGEGTLQYADPLRRAAGPIDDDQTFSASASFGFLVLL